MNNKVIINTTVKNTIKAKAVNKIKEEIAAHILTVHSQNIENDKMLKDLIDNGTDAAIDSALEMQFNEIANNPSIIINNTLAMAGHNLNQAEQKLILIALSKKYLTERSSAGIETSISENKYEFLVSVRDIQEMLDCDYDYAQKFLRNAIYDDEKEAGLLNRQIVFNKKSANFEQILERIKEAYKRDCIKLKITKNFESRAPWLIGLQRDDGWVRFKFSDSALNLLPTEDDLKNGHFTSFKLKAILKLKEHYSIRLYMLLSMSSGLKSFSTNKDDLYLALDIPASYSLKDARKRYIVPAIEEINLIFKLNLKAEWSRDPTSKSRELTKVKFTFNAKLLQNINNGGVVINNERDIYQKIAMLEKSAKDVKKSAELEVDNQEYINDRVNTISDKLKIEDNSEVFDGGDFSFFTATKK